VADQPDEGTTPAPDGADIFRREALEHHNRPPREGDVLKLSPGWSRWTFWMLVGACLAALAYAILGEVGEYATGPAIVRIDGKTNVTAEAAGIVASVDVQPGQRVQAGDLLMRFAVAGERAELDRLQREFELQLVKVLRDPRDEGARASLTSLRASKELAEARLSQRFIRAPAAGVVSDVRIHPGQALAPGEVICSLVGPAARFHVIAMLPGQNRPLLHPGVPLRLELAGYRYAYHDLVVESVADEVVGPTEVRRFLGAEISDTVAVNGPVILVKARLPGRSFVVDGKTYNYFDGMQGVAEARVRSESVLVTFIPALKALTGHGG
jgi:membrane fusion protein, multidrug efflux system